MPSYSRTIPVPGFTADQIYQVLAEGIDRFLEKSNIGHFDMHRDQSLKSVQFKSSMASGSLNCQEGAIRFDVKLSLFATPFRGKIDQGIDQWISKNFPPKQA